MSEFISKALSTGKAIAGIVNAGDLVGFFADPAKARIALEKLVNLHMVPDPREEVPWDLETAGKLAPKYQVVPFQFREEELFDYQKWCAEGTEPLAVRLVTGASGRGKTRLMIQLAGSLRDDPSFSAGYTKLHWIAGFSDVEALQTQSTPTVGNAFAVLFSTQKNLCLIVDYAETKHLAVTKLLSAACEATDAAIKDGQTKRIRIILIARQRTEAFDQIRSDGNLENRAATQIMDEPLSIVPDAQLFYAHACKALDVPSGAREFPTGLTSENPDCGLLSLAALLASDTETPITLGVNEILDNVLEREKRYWKKAAQANGISDVLIDSHVHALVAAYLTFYGLQGAIADRDAGVELISNIAEVADQPLVVQQALVKTIADLYPHSGGRIEGVGLDLLGDHVVMEACANISAQGLTSPQMRSALTRITWIARRDRGPAGKLLNNLLQQIPDAIELIIEMAPSIGEPLAALTAEWLTENTIEPMLAVRLTDILPEQSITLRTLAVNQQALLDAGLDDDGRAGLLNNLANRLSASGQRKEAPGVAQEAVELYRSLAQKNPDAFTPDLAMSLNNLATMLSGLGQGEDALGLGQEAVALRRSLAQKNPDAFTPNLAMSLNNLANWLSDLGQRKEALGVAQEAVEHYRSLAQNNPDAFTPDLAMSLNNLATMLSDLEQREEARVVAQEAVELYRSLAQKNPDAFTPNLAGSLNNLATMLSGLGQRKDALVVAQEAVELRRSLAQKNPDAFTPDLAMSMGVLSRVLVGMEDRPAAQVALHEGISVLEPAFKALPNAFANLMTGLCREYIKISEEIDLEPDTALLGPIVEILNKLD